MEEDKFSIWIRKQKFTILLALFCACLPVALEAFGKKSLEIKWNIDLMAYAYNLCNIIFIFVSLVLITKSDFLLGKDRDDKGRRLSNYVKDKYGSNSTLYREGEKGLFRRMEKSFKQFYYSWIIVWAIWLILYISKLGYLLKPTYRNFYLPQYQNFIENVLNLINSLALFFIYMVITISTVNKKTPGHNLREMNRYIIISLFVAICCIMIDFHSIFFFDNNILYYKYQFAIQLLIGITASISMMAIWGRLNSSYLDIPQSFILVLYFYAAIQMLYPLDLFKSWLKDVYPELKNNDIQIYLDVINKFLYFSALVGKIFLLLTIQWVMHKKRFLFFLINKAHTLAESDDMLNEFNRYYEKYR